MTERMNRDGIDRERESKLEWEGSFVFGNFELDCIGQIPSENLSEIGSYKCRSAI